MEEQQRKEWASEQKRVDRVVKMIEERLNEIQGKAGSVKSSILQLRKNFWDDVTVNLDEPDDVIETHTSLRQQAELLSERERSHGLLAKQYNRFTLLKKSPYFGRIDFKEEGMDRSERIYIGLFSLTDQDGQFFIYDWRAPISSMYYDYAPGPSEYETMDGTIRGEMELKRQFIIRNGVIQGMFDTGVTIGDEILQRVLSKEADPQMKSIVMTIQKEQNAVIRYDRKKYLIVRGPAGSGKTSAALQRIAYFLYRYRGKLTSKNILLFSPNPLFGSYISNVLPELGEENMRQRTFFQYLQFRLGNEWELEDPFSQTEYMLQKDKGKEASLRREGIRFKAGLEFKRLIDRYIGMLGEEGILFKTILFRSEPFIPAEEIRKYFYNLDSTITLPNRIQLVKEWLLKRLGKKKLEELGAAWVEEERELLSREEYVKAYRQLQRERRFTEETFNDFEREERLLAEWIVNKRIRPLRKKIEGLAFLDVKAMYKQLFTLSVDWEGVELPDRWREIGRQTIESLNNNRLPYEDATPYLYLKEKLEGRQAFSSIRHVVIDEAQDYSPFQIVYLREMFPSSRMTILGDVNQSVFSFTEDGNHWLEQSDELFSKEETERMILGKSYRSTKPITDFALDILGDRGGIEPFNRMGELPAVHQAEDRKNLHALLQKRIKALLSKGYETIAILCKTAEETLDAYQDLKHDMNIHLIKKESRSYEKGVNLIPVYLAKGIEFDAVLIYNCSNDHYSREDERKLLYAACTRAMHTLDLYYIGEKSPILDRVNPTLYTTG